MSQSAPFEFSGATLRAEPLTEANGPLRLVWLHGWGQNRESLRAIATSLLDLGEAWLLDLPGHGDAPPPPHAFAPANYAQLVLAWLATQPACPTIVIGHSLGFRVAVHMAQQDPIDIKAIISIAGAGVPRILTSKEKTRRRAIRWSLKLARWIKPFLGEGPLNRLRQRFGSTDYRNSSNAMRPTFVAVVNDNVSSICPTLNQPALLVYGGKDTETPPSVGQRFNRLIPNSQLTILPHHTHYNLIGGGRHVVEPLIRNFIHALTGAKHAA